MTKRSTTIELLTRLKDLGVVLRAERDILRIDAPKGVVDSELKQELADRKAEIVRFLIDSTPSKSDDSVLLQPISRELSLPLSWAQQRLWILNQLEPNSPAYNIPSFARLKGELDVVAFERSLNEIVKRHEALRTTYVFVNGEPTQVVSPSAHISLSVIDLKDLFEREREEKVSSIVVRESRYLFDLQKGPLLRATLLRAGAADHYLIFVVHHIAFDGWSVGVFVREIGALYTAFTAGKPSPLPELQLQYADFAYWQRQLLENDGILRQLAYWKTKLAGRLQKLQLPFDFSQDTQQKYKGGHELIKIPVTVSEVFKSFCHKENATLFMGLLAVLKIVLYRHSGIEDIIVGSPIANRNRAELEGLIGCFLNTLVLRTDLSGNPSFRELLARVREVALGAFANQDIPFERLLEEIRPEREIYRTPVFQVMFVLQNTPMVPVNLPGLTIIPMEIDTSTTKFDLNMHAVETEEGILTAVQFNADLFDSGTIKLMLGSYLTLMESIVSDPDRKITDYPLLTPLQRDQIRGRHNLVHPTNPFTRFEREEVEQSIGNRFEKIAREFPGKIAVKSRTDEWTYEVLNHKANSVANTILKKYKGGSERIALLFEHNVDMIAALMGVLKAGKIYVPLDPSYPLERLSYMIKDSQAKVLLSNRLNIALAGELKTDEITLINIDEMAGLDTDNPNIVVSPDALAYILYTSGSTGKPKGVVQNQRNVLHFTRVYTNSLHISQDDRLTLLSTYGFDAAVMDIFGALLNGATLYPVSIKEEGIADLPSWLIEQKISIYHSTPTVYRFLMDTFSGKEEFPDLRIVVLGGEAVYKRDVDLYKKYFASDCLFVNGLGPTESTVSMQYFLNKESEITRHRVPVGYPVEDTGIFLINNAGNPDDIRGEIGIKSRYVAWGYWDKPDLTKEAFLPDPSGGDERIYRTGDLGRYLPDGSIEYLGRKDFQVKIRGYRIEVGEIETALNEHPAIENCAVFKKTIEDKEYLIACVVPKNPEILNSKELRLFLQKKLPDYMIPSAYVFRDTLPLTPTNKVDLRSLEQLDLEVTGIERNGYVAPKSPTEQLLVEIWSRVLGVQRIGVNDNFFQLGGHSLLAAQMISRVREALDVDLPLRSLFENPNITDLAAYVDQRTGKAEALRLPRVVPIPRDRSLPLSFAQERLWFLNQLEPRSTAYSMPGSIRLRGRLDQKALEQAFTELNCRHETLRTTFRFVDGQVEQVIAAGPFPSLEKVDLRQWPFHERVVEALRLADEQSRKPFDLVSGPLFRTTLYQLDDEDHLLHVNLHHIISDYWSFGVMNREFTELYRAFATGTPPQLPDLPIQYADFAYSQRQWLQGEVFATHLAYWREKLGGELTTLDLPTDRPRPAVQTHHGAEQSLVLSQPLIEALRELSRREGASLFMVLLAVFKMLLLRYTGQEDIVVGTPIAGRNRVELEGLIGFFINTIVMRTDLSGDPSFKELLERVRETALGAYAHQEMPFEKLVEELSPKRDLSRTPLFQVFFNYIRVNESRTELPGLEAEAAGGIEREAKFDMTFYVWEQSEGIRLTINYNTSLFSLERIICFLDQFQNLLDQVVVDTGVTIQSYSLLAPESLRILPDPGIPLAMPPQALVTDMFASWVRRTPGQAAVTKGNQVLTYRELSERALRLAEILQGCGVNRRDVVAVHGPRSFGLIVGMMAVLFSGGVLLPIDDTLPSQGQKTVVLEGGAKFLLQVRGEVREEEGLEYAPGLDIRVIAVDAAGVVEAPTEAVLGAVLLPEVSSDDAAYLFFTSGTTGVPKGILGSHRGLSHFLSWQRETFGITPEDRVAQFTSLSFDPVLREIFLPLTSGATLCLPEGIDILASDDVLSWLERERISILHTVPTLAQSWLTTATIGLPLAAIRCVFFAGEALTGNLVQRWRSAFPGSRVINLYGPTETTLAKCFYEVSGDAPPGIVPLGMPLPQTQALVLSRENRLCGIGEPGEIVLRTPFRSPGYVNNEEENRKRFVKNPFRDDETDLVYFTGDRGRYRPDGMLEFLGRLDDQVKIHGVRVEPGEIAMILAKHPIVDSCFVTNRLDEQGWAYLVAYVVAASGQSTTASELRTYLKERLPATKVPEAFVFLEALPVTPRGKIDRRALPRPDRVRPDPEQIFVAPRTQAEELVAGIWSDVLGRERIGVYDEFFELGGHSLLVMQIISRIRQAFSVELPVRSLFEAPTVAGLTERIEVARKNKQGLQVPPIQAITRDQDLPLSFAQERLWFLRQMEPDSVAYSMPYAIRLKGTLKKNVLKRTFTELARRHETLRTTIVSIDGRPVLTIAKDSNIQSETIDLRYVADSERESEARRLMYEDAGKPFDLPHGPLLRVFLFQLGDREHVMYLNMDHIVSDFWSLGIITREFVALYTSFVKDETSPLPELSIQYVDFACWQRKWLQGDVLKEQIRYWKEKLGGQISALDLPTDYPRPVVQTYRGVRQSMNLPKSLTEEVKAMSRREGATLFMTLLAAFKALLFRLTGQEDILVGTPISGRNRVELEGLIGIFMNTIVMRTDLSGDPTFRQLLEWVRETALGAYTHQEMPFERLVEELAPKRDLSRTPLFQVFFNHIVSDDYQIELPGLELEVFGQMERESKFDMTLYVGESRGEISLTALYNADLFDAKRIATMLGQYQELLRQAVENPEEKIANYSLLTSAEEAELPDPSMAITPAWAGAVHERFSEQAGHAPEQMAIVDRWGNWNYGELERYSNQLAGHLRSNGIEGGDVIAIYGQRSAGLVLALLGVLKAGAAFLILDFRYPASRLVKMLEEASPRGWLQMEAAGSVVGELNEWVDTFQVACRLTIPGTKKNVENFLQDLPSEPPEFRVAPDDKAYITFTSGTTGRPKGIIGTHRPLSHFLEWHCRKFGLKGSDRFSMLSGLSHDPLLRDIFTPLWLGATLCIPDPDDILIPDKLRNWMMVHQITVAHMTPALGQLLSDGAGKANTGGEELAALRYIFFGGDTLTRRHVEKIRGIAPRANCINYYGTTETPQAMGYHVVEARDRAQLGELIPLGNGIDGVQLLVLNPARKLAGVGELGEIYIRTPYLTMGYLNDELLTRDRFVTNPFNNLNNDRLYRTGDLGRYLPDGKVMFYGRGDGQVSIRGFRVELEEIEAILGQHPDIRRCAVVPRDRESGDKYLAAYVVNHDHNNAVPNSLKEYLRGYLPDYMIPSIFIELDEIPLTPNGKVDVSKLIQMEIPPFDRCGVPTEPLTEMEKMLLSIWKEVLSLDHISVHDNFFEIGGHSLLSVQVISRLEKKTGLRINPREFIYQTLGQLAASIEQQIISSSPGAGSNKKKRFWQNLKSKFLSINN